MKEALIVIGLTSFIGIFTGILLGLAAATPPCYKTEDITPNEFYASAATATAVWFEENGRVKVLPLCESYYSQTN